MSASRLLFAAFLLLELASLVFAGVVINTDSGAVIGYSQDGVDIWAGIPFADKPIEAKRLLGPQPVKPWTLPLLCLTQQPICPQFRMNEKFYIGNEDCLYLNVYAPQNRKPDQLLPVMVWIYGGGFQFGDKYEFSLYDGRNMTFKRDVIVVAMNYRVGPLGNLVLDALKGESGTSGNYDLQDQRAALQWVQRNIKAFGGNPKQVTVFGESAGAMSICYHLISPQSANLFQYAIMESGSCDSLEFFRRYDDSRDWGHYFVKFLGCDPSVLSASDLLKCVRSLPTGKIMDQKVVEAMHSRLESTYGANDLPAFVPPLYPVFTWTPVSEGPGFSTSEEMVKRLGQIKTINPSVQSVIAGTNKDEGSLLVFSLAKIIEGIKFPLQKEDAFKFVNHFFNDSATDLVMKMYVPEKYNNSWHHATEAIARDYFFVCPTRRIVQQLTKANVPSYLFQFSYTGDWIDTWALRDYHGSELEFVWDSQFPSFIHHFSKNDTIMANVFGTYWTNLPKFGFPKGDPLWFNYDPVTEYHMELTVPPSVHAHLYREECDMWDHVHPRYWKG
eukprot:TRINITY_DN235_c0_g1_i1.p1 TRINITY_DN235_c0_g1~~TRINITY_DN235_c0_g1_i1.p1  ORF type:complete len:556 (-),score=94.72 TRINITY_DN235_c0_g1_i1:278-1945(-)